MEWPCVELRQIAQVLMGQSPPGDTYNHDGDGLPFFQGKADFGDIYPTARKWCSKPMRVARAGDILLSVRAPVGPTNTARETCCAGRGLAAIRANDTLVEPGYLRFFFKHQEAGLSSQGQGSTFAAISRGEVESIRLPLPPLPEQRQIVDVLNQADHLRRLRAEAAAKADRILPALFLKMFGDPVTNPMSWPIRRFDKVCDSRLGKMLDQKRQIDNNKRPYLRNANVYWDRLELQEVFEMDFSESEQDEFRLRKGDVLVCEGGEIGRSAIWNDDLPECYFQKALHRVRPYCGVATPEFVVFLFWVLAERGALQDTASQMTFSHLTGVKLKALRIPVPPFRLQEKFSARVREARRVLSKGKWAQTKETALMDTLLDSAFLGRL